MKQRVHILDDDPLIVKLLTKLCQSLGVEIVSDVDAKAALQKIRTHPPDLLIVDLQLGELNGLEVMEQVKALAPTTRIIMVTGFSSITTAVEAMRLGAFDYITKPFELPELLQTIKQALKSPPLAALEPTAPASSAIPAKSQENFLGESVAVQSILSTLKRIADSNCSVLITGPAGVGKSTYIHYLHAQGQRAQAPLKTVFLSAYSPEVLEQELFGMNGDANTSLFAKAKGGRVHLAEIHRLPLRLQSRLMAFLGQISLEQSDVCLACSSSMNLSDLVAKEEFRQDLYYKIAVVPLEVPPLVQRREDIASLIRYYLGKVQPDRSIQVDSFAMELLQRYDWPGNISELANAIEYALAMSGGDAIQSEHLPTKLHRYNREVARFVSPADNLTQLSLPLGMHLHEFIEHQQRWYIEETLKFHQGSREKTATSLGISVATLYRKLDLKSKNRTTL